MTSFNNFASQEMFIGKRRLDDVIRGDTEELGEIEGSFEEIADRMNYIIETANTQWSEHLENRRKEIFTKYGYPNTTELFDVPNSKRNIVLDEIRKAYRSPWVLPGEEDVAIVQELRTRGIQGCPFGDNGTSNAELRIKNLKTGKEVTINHLTAHMAREHYLLEKDNQYGISAREFYDHFMGSDKTPDKKRYGPNGDIILQDDEGIVVELGTGKVRVEKIISEEKQYDPKGKKYPIGLGNRRRRYGK